MYYDNGCAAIIMGLFIMFVIGGLVGGCIANAPYETEAIKRGYAVYHPITGKFTWKEDLKNESNP